MSSSPKQQTPVEGVEGVEDPSTAVEGSVLNQRLQVLALMLLTLATGALALVVVLGMIDRDSGGATGGPSIEAESGSGSSEFGGDDPRVVVIGDEWAAGAGATAPDRSFVALSAERLGWTVDVDAVAGSGWTKSAPRVPSSRFVDRAARLSDGVNAPDVVVFSAQTPSGSPLREVARSIEETVETTRTQVPDAVVVVVLPVANSRSDLLCPPEAEDLVCIDTFAEGWLVPGSRGDLMNRREGAPNDAGHARLARYLAEAVRTALPELSEP